MTCYFRHLNGIFAQAGIEVTCENKKELDRILRQLAGTQGNCSVVWRQIKNRLAQDEAGFTAELKAAWENRGVRI
jgi:hypothetical protein